MKVAVFDPAEGVLPNGSVVEGQALTTTMGATRLLLTTAEALE